MSQEVNTLQANQLKLAEVIARFAATEQLIVGRLEATEKELTETKTELAATRKKLDDLEAAQPENERIQIHAHVLGQIKAQEEQRKADEARQQEWNSPAQQKAREEEVTRQKVKEEEGEKTTKALWEAIARAELASAALLARVQAKPSAAETPAIPVATPVAAASNATK